MSGSISPSNSQSGRTPTSMSANGEAQSSRGNSGYFKKPLPLSRITSTDDNVAEQEKSGPDTSTYSTPSAHTPLTPTSHLEFPITSSNETTIETTQENNQQSPISNLRKPRSHSFPKNTIKAITDSPRQESQGQDSPAQLIVPKTSVIGTPSDSSNPTPPSQDPSQLNLPDNQTHEKQTIPDTNNQEQTSLTPGSNSNTTTSSTKESVAEVTNTTTTYKLTTNPSGSTSTNQTSQAEQTPETQKNSLAGQIKRAKQKEQQRIENKENAKIVGVVVVLFALGVSFFITFISGLHLALPFLAIPSFIIFLSLAIAVFFYYRKNSKPFVSSLFNTKAKIKGYEKIETQEEN